MNSSAYSRTITLPTAIREQAAQHLEQAVRRSIDGAAAPCRAFRAADGDDPVFSVPVIEQAAGCLLVLAADSAQSLRPSALRALIGVALHLRDAAEAVRRPALVTPAW
ncbi:MULTISPECIES: hypothetical protein [unclassified Streptomyces]|uniref:hypothetical protein n=1 Tax=unclassified Streptomyces TaxID=2593676 RepID=UPI0013717A04|nr:MULTISPECIES: hypothetical protein [unclassified Streptomyces]MCW5252644.1 hypothetical protein [Streptomyces sp. SHP 1-2]MYU22998.1 hypothetical protein [Streptomyces sp. SID8352]